MRWGDKEKRGRSRGSEERQKKVLLKNEKEIREEIRKGREEGGIED